MAADNQDQGYVPLYTPKRTAPAAAPAVAAPPPAPVRDPNDQGYVPLYQKPGAGQQTGGQAGGGQQTNPPAAPQQGWGVDWNNPWSKGGPALTMPQSASDFSQVAGNEALMGLPGLKAQADAAAARQRIGPVAAGTADMLGSAISPTQFLNAFGGPEVAGAAHEGIKSYMSQPNWIPTQAGAEKIVADTAIGAATGGFARGAAAATPLATKFGVSGGIPLAAGTLGHLLFGHGDPYREAAHLGGEALATLGGHEALSQAGTWAASKVDNPVVRQAVKSLIMGGGSAARNLAGPTMYDQWIPGQ